MDEFDKKSWFRKNWGSVVELNQHIVKNASTHLPLAIRSNSYDSIQHETVYGNTGLVVNEKNTPMFLLKNGAITDSGIDSNYRANLPDEISFYSLQENALNNSALDSEIKEVLGLLDFSAENPYIGTLLCLAAFRADISIWLPIDVWFFIVGGDKSFKNNLAKTIQTFFGSLPNESELVPWTSSPSKLEALAKATNNSVFALSNFEYPTESNRATEYMNKVDDFFRKIHSHTAKVNSKTHKTNFDTNVTLNSLAILTGELPPFKAKNMFHNKGIYVPVKQGDIAAEKRKHLYNLARNGTLARVNAAFIQYLMTDFDGKRVLAEQYKQDYLKMLVKEFPKNSLVCNQLAGLLVAWRFFCAFAFKMKTINNNESKELRRVVRQRMIDLADEQKTISSINPGNLLLKGLTQALKDGRAHILDSETGKQPKGVPSVRVGWKDINPSSLCIGLLKAGTGDLFISSKIDVKNLINLLPEEDRKHFSTKPSKFWIDLKALGLLECPEKDRNRVRKIFPCTDEKEHYQLKMEIVKSAAKN